MRRSISAILALIAAIAIVIPALAQTPVASPEASPETAPYTGLVEGITRQYARNPTQLPAENPEEFVLVSVHLFRFDTKAHAAATWMLLAEDAAGPIPGRGWGDGAGPEIHEEDIPDFGDRARVIWMSATNPDGDTGHYRLLYVQDGPWLVVATTIGGTDENTRLGEDIVRAVTDREAGDGKATFSSDGTSTGGIWNKLPLTGDPGAHDLTAFADKEIPVP